MKTNERAARALAALGVTVGMAACGADSPAPGGDDPAVASEAVTAGYDWPQVGGDAAHSFDDTRETTITRANVASLTRLFKVTLPAAADGAPIALSGVTIGGAARDALFLTTRDGRILARDARTGAELWSAQHGPGTCKINGGSTTCYTTSSPAADPGRAYVYSYGLDGRVHKHAVADGHEVTGGGWPALATTKGYDEKGSSALAVATAKNGASYLYVANGGYPGDRGDYQGHLTSIALSDGTARVFNTLCSDQAVHFTSTSPDCAQKQSAVWARVGVVYDASLDRIFGVTGNGLYAPSQHAWGDTVFALSPDGTGSGGGPIDSYTPTNYQQLQDQDADIGSTAPAILPVPAASKVQNLGLQSGKDAKLRLIDLGNLSGRGAPGNTGGELFVMNVPQGGEVLTAPAVWTNPSDGATWVFVSSGNGIAGLALTVDSSGNPRLTTKWTQSAGGTTPLVANGVLFYESSGNVWARDPTTGAALFHDTSIGSVHWSMPIVANGVLYVPDIGGGLTAFAPPAQSTFAVKVNFEPAGTAVPSGYVADTGAPFGARGNGYSYGWNTDNSAQTRVRNAASSPDARYDTLIHLQKPANPNASWEIAVPSGSYRVRIVSGDPSYVDSVYRINAEGVLALSGTPTAAAHWVDSTVTVTVSDGRLSITNAAGSSNNKIDFIEITKQ